MHSLFRKYIFDQKVKYNNFQIKDFIHSKLFLGGMSGIMYEIIVVAIADNGVESEQSSILGSLRPSPPSNIEVISTTQNSVRIEWMKIHGAISYSIEVISNKNHADVKFKDNAYASETLTLHNLPNGNSYSQGSEF